MYFMVKHVHLTAITLSILLFVGRFVWSQFDSSILHKKWVKILPHVIDTILLASAGWLCLILSQYPFVNGWVTFKVLGLVSYILLGLLALKWAHTPAVRWAGFIGALVVLGMNAQVAMTKQPLFF